MERGARILPRILNTEVETKAQLTCRSETSPREAGCEGPQDGSRAVRGAGGPGATHRHAPHVKISS